METLINFFVANTPPLKVILVCGFPFLLWAYLCLWFSGWLKIKKQVRTGYTRKTFHILIFSSVVVLAQIGGLPIVCLFGGMTTIVIAYALIRGEGHPLYEAMAREKDAPHRTYYIVIPYFATLIGGIASNILVGQIAVVGYLVGGLGDAAGEPIGTRWGKHAYTPPTFSSFKSTRSYEGSFGVFLVSFLAIIISVLLLPQLHFTLKTLVMIPLIAFASMLLEAVSPHGWDNATMQIVPSLMAFALL
jgi:phytol kinase